MHQRVVPSGCRRARPNPRPCFEVLLRFLEQLLLRNASMSASLLSSFVVGPLLGWLAAWSIILVAYLLRLEIREFRRHRRMEAERQRLGLRRAYP